MADDDRDMRSRDLDAQWFQLDWEHHDIMFAKTPPEDERRLVVEREMRRVYRDRCRLDQEADPWPVEKLEAERLKLLEKEQERATYRMTARPWLYTHRWWEPGYVNR